ncbi:hypothetical protein D3C84_120960 [compost metagenome]
MLGQVIGGQRGVAIHMVFADVQAGRHFGVELVGGFQLEAGQLQDIEFDVVVEQIQRGSTQVAADRDLLARCRRHLADQGGDGALGVGAGDSDDRRLGIASEQVDVAGQLDPARGCGLQRRGGDGQARTDQQLAGTAEEVHVQFATTHFHLGELCTQGGQLRRVGTGVDHGKSQALAREKTHQGHAALAEADNDAELVGSDQAHSLLNAISRWQDRSAPESR